MKFINLTSRTITIVDEDDKELLVLRPSGIVIASVTEMRMVEQFKLDTAMIDVVNYSYRGVSGLPDPVDGVRLVVSYAVLQALDGTRDDVIAPDTSPGSIVRESHSQKVLGVKRFRVL